MTPEPTTPISPEDLDRVARGVRADDTSVLANALRRHLDNQATRDRGEDPVASFNNYA